VSLDLNQVIAVILAGGFGTRVKHLLPNLPKPMAPVAGKPFLEWVVRYLAKQGVNDVIISTGYLADVVAEHFTVPLTPSLSPSDGERVPGGRERSAPLRFNVRTRCAVETAPLGTAGGFLNAARSAAKAPAAWLVLNGDSLVFAELASMAAKLSLPDAEGVILGSIVADASRYGSLVTNGDGDLVRFAEKKPGAGVISAGVYLLRHSLIDKFPPGSPLSFELDVFPGLLSRGARLKVVETNAPFLDIGTEETLAKAENFIRQNLDRFDPS
jgi:D-glycero-alpha-D-manno-heptose 1-phosphate guanylyltransferase